MAKKKLDKSQRIGVCEAGEIAFNLDAFDRLYDGNIIITKRLTNKVIEKLIEHKDKIILHLTCTGMGGTCIEPLVPKAEETLEKLKQLIEGGFPTEQIINEKNEKRLRFLSNSLKKRKTLAFFSLIPSNSLIITVALIRKI